MIHKHIYRFGIKEKQKHFMSHNIFYMQHRRTYQFIRRANMNQFIRRRNQIEFFVRFKADRSLKCLHYDPYVYDIVYLVWFHCW